MNKNIYEKLTDATKLALDETIQEVRDNILEKAYKNAVAKNTADKEISLRDLIEAKEEILYKRDVIQDKVYKRKRIISLLSTSGALYAVFGIVFYLIQNKSFDIVKDLGLVIAAIGILVSVLAFYLNQLISNRKFKVIQNESSFERDNSEFEIVRRWKIIENLGTDLMKKNNIPNDKIKSINFLLSYLSMVITDSEKAKDLQEILIVRNNILHNGLNLNRAEIEKFINKADLIIEELEKNLKKQKT
jgi:hypothetical protein